MSSLEIIREDYLEILRLLKKEGEMQASKLAKSVKSVSESEAYKRIKKLRELGLIEYHMGENERGQPIKIYKLSKLGEMILERLEEITTLYKAKSTAINCTV